MMATGQTKRPVRLFRNLNAKIASIPMILVAVVIFLGGSVWTVVYSFTNSKLLPRLNFVGLDQYERLWGSARWLISIQNLAVYGFFSLIFSLVIGFLLAALMDQKIRFENLFRTIFSIPLRFPSLSPALSGNGCSTRNLACSRWCAAWALPASPSIRSIIPNW